MSHLRIDSDSQYPYDNRSNQPRLIPFAVDTRDSRIRAVGNVTGPWAKADMANASMKAARVKGFMACDGYATATSVGAAYSIGNVSQTRS
ncbi:uncharacterized protein RHO25_010074 [Cercospora beticola]|uniref:Uncharacterized protein n=1 Tax=Cercospora beticola TaxID=122368 RepID=A0ABZ0P0P3_CERBT|nr:hypothetical protein RHO25_010074 [Cercospora beticola]